MRTQFFLIAAAAGAAFLASPATARPHHGHHGGVSISYGYGGYGYPGYAYGAVNPYIGSGYYYGQPRYVRPYIGYRSYYIRGKRHHRRHHGHH